MSPYRLRIYEGPHDAERQYQLWLDATADLPYAWRSNMANVRHLIKQAERYPEARIYAEDTHGRLAGYIGVHPPFEWKPDWWTLPFGFPWTAPVDRELERELYERMFRAGPDLFPGQRRDVYVQRFRASWRRHLDFLMERGWKEAWRQPILARRVTDSDPEGADAAVPVTETDLPAIAALAGVDQHACETPGVEALRRRVREGWLVGAAFWQVPERGAFALEVRRPWAEVRLLFVRPDDDALHAVLRTMAAVARRLEAEVVYITLENEETQRLQQLTKRGFEQADAGVYLVYELQREKDG